MVNGPLTQEVSPAAPDRHSHRHSHRHPYSLQVLHHIPLNLVRINFSYIYKIQNKLLSSVLHLYSNNYTASHHFLAGSSDEGSNIIALCSTSVAITAVVSCAVSFIIGTLVGAVVYYCTVRKKSNCQKCYSLAMAPKQQQPAPVYEDVIGQSQNIELKENVAYGPVQQ